MSDQEKTQRFTNYRYYKPKTHLCPKVALKIAVDHAVNELAFSFAVCSDEDNFSRVIARNITTQRFADGQVIKGLYDTSKSLVENASDITSKLVSVDRFLTDKDEKRVFHNLKLLNNAFDEIRVHKGIEESLDVMFAAMQAKEDAEMAETSL